MTESRFSSRLLKYSAVFPLVLFVSSGLQARVLEPGETAVVTPLDTPENWNMATGATLTVNGGSILSLTGGGAAGTLNLNTGSRAQDVSLDAGSVANITDASIIANNGTIALNVTDGSAVLSNATVVNTNGIGIFGSQAANGPGSAFVISAGSVSGSVGGITLSTASTLDMTGTTVTGTGASSYGIRGFSSDMTLRNSTVSGGLNGILYRVDPARVREGTVNIEGSHIEGAAGAAILINGTGTPMVANFNLINGTTLEGGNGNALEVANSAAANVLLQDSEITGDISISNNSIANLTFNHGRLIGNVSADGTSGGLLALSNGSSVEGNVTGINNVSLDASSMTGDLITADSAGVVSLQNRSRLEGNVTGANNVSLDASSMIGDITTADAAGIVSVRNGSVLEGNIGGANTVNFIGSSMTGNITTADGSGVVSLQGGSVLNGNVVGSNSVSLDSSQMTGDITSDGTGVVSLQNNSVFTGNLINVDTLTVGDPSVWNMVASNTLNSLVMDTGEVRFGAANEFFTLNVGNLSGSGTFAMDVDYATNEHDRLNVTGSATGSHTLLVNSSGEDPANPQQLTLVQTAAGDATFALVGGQVDVGTYSYDLASRSNGSGGTDWFLDPSTAVISPGTASVLALFNTAPTVWYGELTSLRSRMGELRFNGGKAGGWVRSYGNKYNVDEASGLGYQQTQQGFSLGADAPLPIGDGQWLIGVLAGHSKSDLNVSRGTSGTVKSYYAGVYTTWLDQDSGYYFDGVLKFNRFRNDSKVGMSDGTRAKGDYDNVGMGGSLEFGKHIKLDDGYFVEPFTQLSAVVIQGKDYHLDNDMKAEGDRTRSMLGKVGVTAGRNFVLDNGSVLQPYLRVAGVHEFAKNNEVQVNDNQFNNDLSGSRGELGAGVAVAFSDNLQMHADFDYSNGQDIEQPFGANVGLRYSW
jgi:outer membrane autotransporter protein